MAWLRMSHFRSPLTTLIARASDVDLESFVQSRLLPLLHAYAEERMFAVELFASPEEKRRFDDVVYALEGDEYWIRSYAMTHAELEAHRQNPRIKWLTQLMHIEERLPEVESFEALDQYLFQYGRVLEHYLPYVPGDLELRLFRLLAESSEDPFFQEDPLPGIERVVDLPLEAAARQNLAGFLRGIGEERARFAESFQKARVLPFPDPSKRR